MCIGMIQRLYDIADVRVLPLDFDSVDPRPLYLHMF